MKLNAMTGAYPIMNPTKPAAVLLSDNLRRKISSSRQCANERYLQAPGTRRSLPDARPKKSNTLRFAEPELTRVDAKSIVSIGIDRKYQE